MATNLVDQAETRPVDLGPCRCPGGPHTGDSAEVRVRFGWGERQDIRDQPTGSASNLRGMVLGVKAWNLVLPDGQPRPVSAVEFIRLDDATAEALIDELTKAMEDEPLPNASSDPSPDGSQTDDIPTPTSPSSTETSPSSTTS